MKALSIKQPWAYLIVHGINGRKKTIETRTWNTRYRGDLLIVSSKKPMPGAWVSELDDVVMGFGLAIGIAELVDCRPMTRRDQLVAMCKIYPGAFSWVFENVRAIEPFAVSGRLRLYEVDYAVTNAVGAKEMNPVGQAPPCE